ncbi:hypothetical protein MRX96_056999 [Rhipicephalus microplus]
MPRISPRKGTTSLPACRRSRGGLASSVFTGADQTEENEDARTLVTEATAVPAGLAVDVGSHIQWHVEDDVSRFLSDSTNKVPVTTHNFVLNRLFELAAAFCGDLRVEAATERGAAVALRGQLTETRQEMAALPARGPVASHGGAAAGPQWFSDVDRGQTRGPGAPGFPPAVHGAAGSYAAAITSGGPGPVALTRGLDAGGLPALAHIRTTSNWRS